MNKAKKSISDYKSISDRQLELMNDSQLITTRNMLKIDLNSGKADPEGLMVSDYNRVCVRMAERLERCYAFGLIPGRSDVPESLENVVSLKSELEKMRAENRRLLFELTGVEPEPELPFYYPDDDSDDSVLIV